MKNPTRPIFFLNAEKNIIVTLKHQKVPAALSGSKYRHDFISSQQFHIKAPIPQQQPTVCTWPEVLPYVHRVSHSLKKVAGKYGVPIVLSAPKTLSVLCSRIREKKTAPCDKRYVRPLRQMRSRSGIRNSTSAERSA